MQKVLQLVLKFSGFTKFTKTKNQESFTDGWHYYQYAINLLPHYINKKCKVAEPYEQKFR